MAENKKSFIFYCDWKDTFDQLPDEKAGELIKHLLAYVNDENPKTDDILINAVFANIRNALKRDLVKFEEIKLKRSESGKLGGRPKKQTKAKKPNAFTEKQSKAKKADSVNENVSVTVSVNDNDKIKKVIKSGETSSHTLCKNVFLDYYQDKNGTGYDWSAKDGKAMSLLIPKIERKFKEKNVAPKKESVADTLRIILYKIEDDWLLRNMDMTIINSQFNKIYTQVINPQKTGWDAVL